MLKQNELNEFYIGLENECKKTIFAEQKMENWCWAATTQMVLMCHCVDVKQEQLVEILSKNKACYPDCPDNFYNIANLLNNRIIDGKKIIAKAFDGLPDANHLINELVSGNPVIIGVKNLGNIIPLGHAVVLTNLKYKIGFNGVNYIYKLYVLDPATTQENINRNGMFELEIADIVSNILSYLIIHTESFHQITNNIPEKPIRRAFK